MNILIFVIPAVILFGCGAIAGGGVMCWQSTIQHSCSDLNFGEFGQTCGYTNLNVIAAIKCNTVCYCQDFSYDYHCLDMPHGVSPTYIGWGVFLILIGLIILGVGAFFIVAKL
jgi:hypothetical protein